MTEDHIEAGVDLFMDVFSREPWNETYDSREQVIRFFRGHLLNNYFVGYVMKEYGEIVAISLGMKKLWLQGTEYYIDQFCVKFERQGEGIGSRFLKMIEDDLESQGMNVVMLNTEKGFPSEQFYIKNGF